MHLQTPVCDLLCCEHPVVLAGMGGVARSELVAAVTEAGGFGFLGMVRESAEMVASEIAAVRARTARPFGVNLIPAATRPERLAGELDACIAAKVHAVTLFWDLSPETVKQLRGEGILVVCQVGSLSEARAAEDAGADILIAQGLEAGGHVRGLTGLHALLAQVLPAVDVPVLAAGGVTDGADLAAVIKLGAQGAVLGTAFLATEESFAHDYHKQRILQAAGETVHTQAFHINWPAGAYVRVLPNSVTRGERGDPFAAGRQVIGADGARSIYLFSTDSPLRSMSGDFEAMALYAGQGAGRLQAIVPAAERLRAIVDQARACVAAAAADDAGEHGEVRRESSSPVCYAAEADDAYMGYLGADELAAELNVLLEAERAGARVAARMAAEARDPELKALTRIIHADEARWCKALMDALGDLGVAPSAAVGAFYDSAMAIEGVEARLAFVNRGQGWVARKLRTLLPKIRDDALHEVLRQMLEAHEQNIAAANTALDARGARPGAAAPA